MSPSTTTRDAGWGVRGTGLAEGLPAAPSPGGRFFTLEQRARMKGRHLRQRRPAVARVYVAGVALPRRRQPPGRLPGGLRELMAEPVTVSIAEVDPWGILRVVEHYRWAQHPDAALVGRLRETLWGLWGCRTVLVDGTAAGERVLRALPPESPEGALQLAGEAMPRPPLGLGLLAAVEEGRVSVYADDGSIEHRDFWAQAVRARVCAAEGRVPDFYVEPSTGDDGFLRSLALAVEAARWALARGRLAQPIPA